MQAIEKKVLSLLNEDARYTAAKIAVMLGISEAEVAAIIKKFEANGVIVKYAAVINNEKLDEDFVDALIEVKVTPKTNRGFDAIAQQLLKFDEVKNVYLLSGSYDFMVTLEGKSLRDVAMFVSDRLSVIEDVLSTVTHFILKQYKQNGIILDKGDGPKRMPIH